MTCDWCSRESDVLFCFYTSDVCAGCYDQYSEYLDIPVLDRKLEKANVKIEERVFQHLWENETVIEQQKSSGNRWSVEVHLL